MGHQLEKNSEDHDLLIRYTDALHEMDILDGYTIHHRTEEILQGLGFANADLHRPETPAALRERWVEVMSWGVHGICTDYPIALRSVLEGADST